MTGTPRPQDFGIDVKLQVLGTSRDIGDDIPRDLDSPARLGNPEEARGRGGDGPPPNGD